MSDKKRVVIIKHGGGRLGNQLLLFYNVFAYCLERGYSCSNYSFYNYNKYFNFPVTSPVIKFLGLIDHLDPIKSHASYFFIYKLYTLVVDLILLLDQHRSVIIKQEGNVRFCLPPTKNKNRKQVLTIQSAEQSFKKTIYLDGFFFENPLGIKKHHNKLHQLFAPRKKYLKKVNKFLFTLRKYRLVGVHIRQGDYRRFTSGSLYFDQPEIAKILEHFWHYQLKDDKSILFLLFSDGPINFQLFKNLPVKKTSGHLIEDLFLLSKCNIIIGSKSSFSTFAALYGEKPLYIFNHQRKYRKDLSLTSY